MSTWKKFERKVADYFGTVRTPLSGSNSRHTASDTLHPELFIEAKYNIENPLVPKWNDYKKKRDNIYGDGRPVVAYLALQDLVVWHSEETPVALLNKQPLSDWEIFEHLYVVPVYRSRDSWVTKWRDEDLVRKAQREDAKDSIGGKTPVFCTTEKYKTGFWILCRSFDAPRVLSFSDKGDEENE